MKRPAPGELRRALPPTLLPLLDAVLGAADAADLPVFLVGGPVRDLLLGAPVRDIDLLVLAEPAEVFALAERAAPEGGRVVRHERFGTARLQDAGVALDLASARREVYAHPGALPAVSPGTLEEDLLRRDFSVNALALPLSKRARARAPGIQAPPGAEADLAARRLRVLHRASLSDDPTRALRAARLAPRLGFRVAAPTRQSLLDALRSGAFGRVSGERLRRECVRLFDDAALGVDPVPVLRRLAQWGVLGAIEPELGLPPAAVPVLRRLGRAVHEPPWPPRRFRPWLPGLALWLGPCRPGLRRRALSRLAIRGAPAARIEALVRGRDARLRALARCRGRGAVDALLAPLAEEELQALHAWAPPPLRRRIARFAREDRARRTPVSGEDLVALAIAPPQRGRALARIRAAFLDGAVRSRDEALVLAREVARRS